MRVCVLTFACMRILVCLRRCERVTLYNDFSITLLTHTHTHIHPGLGMSPSHRINSIHIKMSQSQSKGNHSCILQHKQKITFFYWVNKHTRIVLIQSVNPFFFLLLPLYRICHRIALSFFLLKIMNYPQSNNKHSPFYMGNKYFAYYFWCHWNGEQKSRIYCCFSFYLHFYWILYNPDHFKCLTTKLFMGVYVAKSNQSLLRVKKTENGKWKTFKYQEVWSEVSNGFISLFQAEATFAHFIISKMLFSSLIFDWTISYWIIHESTSHIRNILYM